MALAHRDGLSHRGDERGRWGAARCGAGGDRRCGFRIGPTALAQGTGGSREPDAARRAAGLPGVRSGVRQGAQGGAAADSPGARGRPADGAEVREVVTAFFREYAGSGNAEAIADLGRLLRWLEDLAEAQVAFQQAADLGSAQAVVALGGLRMAQRNVTGARALYQAAVDSGPADAALAATVELGHLLRRHDHHTDRPGLPTRVWHGDSGISHHCERPLRCPIGLRVVVRSRTTEPDPRAAGDSR
jgi:hypothetical protein